MANTTSTSSELNNVIDTLDGSSSSMAKLQFPASTQNEIPNWITITRKKYQKPSLESVASLVTAENSKTVVLPLPTNMQKPYYVTWDNSNLGSTMNQISGAIAGGKNLFDDAIKNSESIVGSAIDQLKSNGWSPATNFLTTLGANIARGMFTNNELFNVAGYATGYAKNPFKALMFETPNFRKFNFTYKLIAKNLDEANTIRDIIKEFHIGMAPSLVQNSANWLYSYPDLFVLTLTDDSYLFKFAPCILTDFTAQFQAEGTPVFFKSSDGTRVPGSVQLELTFQETVILSREDFEGGY